MDDVKIRVEGLYKIFGARPHEGMQLVRDGISKADLLEHHGHVLGLQDINVDMRTGETTVIMGLSGSGKSTLIRHLNRLIEPTVGQIFVNGQDVMKLPPAAVRQLRRKSMSMVFQKFALLPHETVLANTMLAPVIGGVDRVAAQKDAEYWLDRVGLDGQGGQYPSQLSGGMQQRVGIARALTANTDVMLLDEAFSALDPLIRTDMQDLLLDLQRELHKTVVFITHDLDESLKLADHLVILKDGRVVQQGEPQEILLNPSDPYIEDFVSDINRARVLRVRSIMAPPGSVAGTFMGEVDPDENLESLIARSGGDTSKNFKVTRDGEVLGDLEMTALIKALVPRASSRDNASRRVF